MVMLSAGLGLFGFIEPCSVASNLLFIKYLEGKSAAGKILETGLFAVTRAALIGLLGAVAALVGSAFVALQHWFWIALGLLYIGIGAFYVFGKQGVLARAIGPRLQRVDQTRGAAALGLLFGLNIPACAAPLLAAVFAASVGTAVVAQGFTIMAVFGLALSPPLVVAVFWRPARGWLDRLAALSQRLPFWVGVLFIVLGAWSIYFAWRYP